VCRKGAVSAQPSSSLAAADIRSALDAWYDKGYTVAMKTAVSVPNDLFVHAEHLASQLGISRSELYARALRELVDRLESATVTKQLDAAYAKVDSSLPPDLAAAAQRTLFLRQVTGDPC